MLSSLVYLLAGHAGCVCCCVVEGHRRANVDTLDDDVGVASSVALASLPSVALYTAIGWWQPTERYCGASAVLKVGDLVVVLDDCLLGYRCLA